MFNFIDIYSCMPVCDCVGMGHSALLCLGFYNAVKALLYPGFYNAVKAVLRHSVSKSCRYPI